ncbi:NAD(P)/FAD-dependent oxidoreductase [Telmatospirillum sp. J64-1]|uniref:dihydrolipoyl dehydrogenase family protein n=1 Tax=Telmatospirillum sp. J64-1 TaxID=2502183 RepID=UPI00115D3429|nr:FAD-dependent oxidoreductase [Telmatospirillum sp. J64-1]
MAENLTPELCVIGAGAAGLSVASGAARLGASVVLVEKGAMGGDRLNTGCVPSKALLACARAVHDVRNAGRFGVSTGEVSVDFAQVKAHLHGVMRTLAEKDSAGRFEELGVQVTQGTARFTAPGQIRVGETTIRARRFVIATGGKPKIPAIEGLDQTPFLTNETIFALDRLPRHLLVLGGGATGVELAQAFRRLGSAVTLIEAGLRILPEADADLAAMLRDRLRDEGVDVVENMLVTAARPAGEGAALILQGQGGRMVEAEGSHLLLATGRMPDLEELRPDDGGIHFQDDGILVDEGLRTNDPNVFAVGDAVAGAPRFAHVANWHAAQVLRRMFFRLPVRLDYTEVPAVVYGDPELAWVGLDEETALRRYEDVRIERYGFAETDRAWCDGRTEGQVKIVATRRGKVLGAAILGQRAGELIQPWVAAVRGSLGLKDMAEMVVPYPTLAEASKQAAGKFFEPMVFSDKAKGVARLLGKLP